MNKKQHILIVEDEPAIHAGLTDVFVYHGYDVTVVEDGEQGVAEGLTGRYDLILLDVMLPKRSGFEVCEVVRAKYPAQPIIMLTAKISDQDIVAGLRLGADDYVTKPFSVEQLVLRVAAVLRRSDKVSFGLTAETDIKLDPWQVSVASLSASDESGAVVKFTRREMEVLLYLAHNNDRPVPREELLAKVWGYNHSELIETRTVDIHIAKIRKKIEADASAPKLLQTVRGAGYQLVTAH
jgi:two-component system response regulator RegX3